MKLKKLLSISLSAILSMSLLTGCKSKEKTHEDISIGVVLSEGRIDDLGSNKSIWEGLEKAKAEFGINIEYIESKQESEYITNIESLIANKVDLIIAVGEPLKDVVKEVAGNYTDQKFAVIDQFYKTIPNNVAQISFKEEEGAYLAGALATKITETDNLGFIGDMPDEITQKYKYGFKYGAESTNLKIKIQDKYTNASGDEIKEKDIAKQMYESNIDLIFSVAKNAGAESIKVAKEMDKYAIGVDENRRELAPDNVLTSVLKKLDVASYNLAKNLIDGDLEYGVETRYGLEEGAIALSDGVNKHINEELLEYINELSKEIKDGDIEIPSTEKQYKSMTRVVFE